MRTNTLKLKNRRVIVGRKKDENICVIFKRLREKEEKEVLQSNIVDGKIVETVLNISKEAAVSLFFLLQNELNMRDLAAFEIDSKQTVIKLKIN